MTDCFPEVVMPQEVAASEPEPPAEEQENYFRS